MKGTQTHLDYLDSLARESASESRAVMFAAIRDSYAELVGIRDDLIEGANRKLRECVETLRLAEIGMRHDATA